jgi:hypothetical protein
VWIPALSVVGARSSRVSFRSVTHPPAPVPARSGSVGSLRKNHWRSPSTAHPTMLHIRMGEPPPSSARPDHFLAPCSNPASGKPRCEICSRANPRAPRYFTKPRRRQRRTRIRGACCEIQPRLSARFRVGWVRQPGGIPLPESSPLPVQSLLDAGRLNFTPAWPSRRLRGVLRSDCRSTLVG